MTNDELIDLADRCNVNSKNPIEFIQKFANAVASAEREACAKVCEDLDAWNMDDPASTAAKAIRARGQA